jgi:hypothetical protein
MPQDVNKVVVTNLSALKEKYGTGAKDIQEAVKELIAADKKRGLVTQLVDLGSTTHMRKFKGKKVRSATSPRDNKVAIDKIYKALTPDYIVLLGSIDVIPHQNLKNPVPGDDDQTAESDLPYACEHGHSLTIEDFKGPTRVVGRLPDLTGGDDPAYLVRLLSTAAKYKPRPREDFTEYLGITAKVWQESTKESLTKIFGSSQDLQTSPSEGPKWTAAQLKRRSHFINCHGAPANEHYYGEHNREFPEAHDAALIDGKLSVGTIAAAECCYGAELYDPDMTEGQAGICSTYLGSDAYAFFGSSTIAYGPSEGNGAADLITQFFLRHVLAGASAGRAALQARQDYVLKHSMLDPIDLKTLAQFNLMGDPSVHPVRRDPPTHLVATTKAAKSLSSAALGVVAGLAMRRTSLAQNGLALAAAAVSALTDQTRKTSQAVAKILHEALAEANAEEIDRASFDVGTAMKGKSLAKIAPSAAAVHVAVGRIKGVVVGKEKGEAPAKQFCAVVAREQDGTIAVRRLFSR